ncbi:cytochrome P450 [Micromonospora sp. HNM0581]|uniref:cytochrome P450 n=1 Tax=Micromonospora sp. HNM0581 TaxID=2716341 RepID=UPI00146D2A87|nr:cytochrome P450 [Micromonospora sp. HNM0581]
MDIDLADPAFFAEQDFVAYFRRLREESPLHWNPDGKEPGFWSLTRYDDCARVQKDPVTFSSEVTNTLGQHRWTGDHGAGRMLTHTDGRRHTELRGIVGRAFTPRAISALEPYLRSVVQDTFEQALEQRQVDFVETMAMLPVASIAALLGVPRADWLMVLKLTTAAFGAADRELGMSRDARVAAAAAHTQLLLYCQDLMEDRRRQPREDIATRLVQAQEDGRLTEEEAMLFFDLLLLGGNETTRHGAVGALLALIAHPEQWATLRREPALLDSAVQEVLRHVSPSRHVLRSVTTDIELYGQTIRAGEQIVIWHSSANRDAAAFDRPDEFRLDRDPNPHLGLGSGTHYCVGASLATLELRLTLEALSAMVGSARVLEPPVPLASTVINGFKQAMVELTPS